MKPTQELRKKIWFTILIIVLYRFGTYVPLPSINTAKLAEFAAITKSGVFAMLNMFSGGSVGRVSIFTLGIMPYITASIAIQLLVATTPSLKQMKSEDGEAGQQRINQYTRYLTIFIGLMQGFMLASSFVSMELYSGNSVLNFKILSAITMMTSTIILVWLAGQCTNKGIGNGTSIIIFAGILAEAPRDLFNVLSLSKTGSISTLMLLGLFAIFIITILFVVFVERSNRLIYIQYPRQSHNFMGRKPNMPKQNFLPLKVNTAGVMPPILASTILLLPVTISSVGNQGYWSGFIMNHLSHGKPLFMTCYTLAIIFFTFFYNNVIFDTKDIADNLRRNSIFIPGCRPGAPTIAMLQGIVKKLSFLGASYLIIICLIPELFSSTFGYSFLLGGTGILIVVNVIIDTTVNIQINMLHGKYQKVASRFSLR